MGDQYGGAIIRQFPEPLEHFELTARIQRCRWLIQDHHLRIAHPRAGNGDLLPLATGQVHALLETAADQLVVATGQLLDHFSAMPRRAASAMRAWSSIASTWPTPMFSPLRL